MEVGTVSEKYSSLSLQKKVLHAVLSLKNTSNTFLWHIQPPALFFSFFPFMWADLTGKPTACWKAVAPILHMSSVCSAWITKALTKRWWERRKGQELMSPCHHKHPEGHCQDTDDKQKGSSLLSVLAMLSWVQTLDPTCTSYSSCLRSAQMGHWQAEV